MRLSLSLGSEPGALVVCGFGEQRMADVMDQDGPPPNQTLYVCNINASLSKRHRLHELKEKLTNLCKPGEVIDIVALSNFYAKGQAFVVLKNLEQAEAAMKKLQGHELEGQAIKVAYAKSKSNAVEKIEGTFTGYKRVIKPKPPTGVKKAKPTVQADSDDESAPPPAPGFAPPAAGYPPQQPGAPQGYGGAPPGHAGMPQPPQQQQAVSQAPPLPHPILFLENVPHSADSEAVAGLFRAFMGYKEVRMVPSRPGLAFVEFENEMQSGVAMQRLQGVDMQGQALKITFSRS
uniref:RRM domain-containing protein n=2 Tax=Hemiselmis andersenii TaxID=464988 RepID=A0A7S1EKN1_HEMAN|mmetsp:Transcript_51470/g.124789  ORF Transcript_51470/g.124789 Transcript_51470/m.124789 type:complete len:290 (+) Transcript_51470:1-870(+)